MGFQYKEGPAISVRVTQEHVREARPQDPEKCSLALAGRDAIQHTMHAAIDGDTGEVRVTWKESDPQIPGRVWMHSGYLRPLAKANQILLVTDASKKKMIGRMPVEGVLLTIEDHLFRKWEERTPEVVTAERQRKVQLRELRLAGLAPPARKRPELQGKGRRRGALELRGAVYARPPS